MQTVKCFGSFRSFCEDSELDAFLSFKHRLLFPKMVYDCLVIFNKRIYPSNVVTVK